MGFFKNLSSRKNVMNTIGDECGYIKVDDELRSKIQAALLEMLLDIDRVCTQNNIEYFLNGGSCLGAVRHKGFIPWDDDIDISMKRDEYKKFITAFEKHLSDKYILNAPNYSDESIARFPKVLKKDSLYITNDTTNPNLCKLYVDIFLAENIPDNKIRKLFKGIICNLLEFIAGQVHFIKTSTKQERKIHKRYDAISYYIRCLIGKLFSLISISKYNNMIDKIVQCNESNSKNCGFPTDRRHYFGEVFPKTIFSSVVRVPFEGYMLPIPVDYEEYLKKSYGDYMKIPNEEEREHHYIRKINI